MEHPPNGYGAGLVNLRSGTSSAITVKDNSKIIIAHGVLMAVAWVLLLPLGAMAPAHRCERRSGPRCVLCSLCYLRCVTCVLVPAFLAITQ